MALLRIPDPYDFELSTERFRAFGPDLANLWVDGVVYRVVDGREVRIAQADGGVDVEPLDARTEPAVRKLIGFDFGALDDFYELAAEEPVLARLLPHVRGLRPPLAPDPFEALVSSISAQQVSLFSAFAVRSRFIARFGEPHSHAYGFPTTERVAAANEDELLELGFSRRKAEYILGIARDPLDWDELERLPDDEVKARIVARRGLGEWSADWFLARYLARPRAWPAGDLGLRKAVVAFYGDVDVRAAADRFEPFQNLSAHYLLTGLRVVGA